MIFLFFFFFEIGDALLAITEKKIFFFSNLRTFFLSLNEKYYMPFEREFIQEENATKFTFPSFFLFFFLMNIYVNVTYFFFLFTI